jgi:hypothetical protein
MLVRLAPPVPRDAEGAPVQWRADGAQRPEDGAKRLCKRDADCTRIQKR